MSTPDIVGAVTIVVSMLLLNFFIGCVIAARFDYVVSILNKVLENQNPKPAVIKRSARDRAIDRLLEKKSEN